jgi:RNA polymerase sigma-70 factor (ECF subfamily)
MDDAELTRRCVAQDPSAWAELVHQSLALVHHTIGRVLHSGMEAEVEDVTQTVFLKLLDDDCRRLRSFQARSKLSTWLVAVARREAFDFLRRRGAAPPETRLPVLLAGELREDAGAGLDAAEAHRRLNGALERLPVRDGLLMRLIYLDGASYEDAAQLLGVPLNSISPWVGRAKSRLRALLTPENPETQARCT